MRETTWRYYIAFVLILWIALLGRIWVWNDQARAGWIQAGDEDEYYRGAIHLLLQGNYYDEGQWLRPPVDSVYLAVAFSLFGVNVPAALLFETAVSLVTIALVASLTHKSFRRRDYALASALAAALFLPWMAYASRLLSENLFTLFLALAFNFLVRTRSASDNRYLFLSGVTLALATLTRPLLLYAIPLLFLWVWSKRRNLVRAFQSWCILFLGFLFLIAPWTARNYIVYHQIVIVDTNGGVSFWFGTLLDPSEQKLQDYWKTTLPNSALRQQAALAKGLENIRSDPLRWIGRIPPKIAGTFQPDTRNFINNSGLGPLMVFDSVPYVLMADAEYIVLSVLALVGLALTRKQERDPILLAWIPYMIILSALTVGNARFRIPMMIVPFVYAAPILAYPQRMWSELRHLPRVRHVFLGATFSLFFVLVFSTSYLPFFASQFWLVIAHFNRDEHAAAHAINALPENVFPYIALGDMRRTRGDSQGALAAFSQGAAVAPENANTQAKRIFLLEAMSPSQVQAATDAVTQVAKDGWDNSQWYEWAWDRVPYRTANLPDITVPAVGIMRGVYAAEFSEGEPSRWTLYRPAFRLAHPGATTITMRVRADQDKEIGIFVDRELLETLKISRAWTMYTLNLNHPAGAQTLLELQTGLSVSGVDKPYARGVAINQIILK